MLSRVIQPVISKSISRITAGIWQSFDDAGFNPRNLFAANEPGYLYDLDDLSTVFLDSAGTTPATVNGLVGLVLDKSKGLALGAEVITNAADREFTSDTGYWTKSAGAAVIGGGKATLVTGDQLQRILITTAGKWYRIEYDLTVRSGTLYLGNHFSQTNSGTSGRKSFLINAITTTLIIRCDTGDVDITNITIKELPGNHRYQATTGLKPILRGTPTGANLASGASWTAGTGWSIAGDTATATLSSGTLTAAAVAAVVGKFYRVTYTITRTAGSIQPTLGGRTGTARSASGTYVQYFDNATSTAALVFTGTGFSGTVTLNTIEAVDVSAGSVAAPYALQYDGVDDFLQTAAVDFTATDKMTVCHGVRKLSDSAQGIVVEHTASLAANNGSFYLAAPNSAAANFAFASKGTVSATDVETTFTAPISAVLTGVGNISGDSALLRVSGVAGTAVTTDQGTGNYANAAIYFGRRGGTSLPYNGLEYSSICIGRLLTAAELANIERWVARKTGVTL